MNYLLFALIIFTIYFAGVIMRTREMEAENRMKQAYMDSIQGLYDTIRERIEATRRYRHDLAKHIQTLEALLENKYQKSEEMQPYLDELKIRYEQLKKTKYCRDDIVNTILIVTEKKCEEESIPLRIQVDDAFYGELQETELVGLLYNLLDNAREANARIPEGEEKGVFFSMGKSETDIYIELENHFSFAEIMDFRTKKMEKDQHGIGMKIIDSIVTKYHGSKKIEVDEENHLLIEKIYLRKK
ncbi:MAG: sensor histidine kinase [Lachnospiraceae bacterium]